jgi:hypothetical protein
MIVPKRLARGVFAARNGDGSLHHLLCIHRLLHAAVHRNLVDFGKVLPVQADQIRTEPRTALRIHVICCFTARRQNDQIPEFGKFLSVRSEQMPGTWWGSDVVGRSVRNYWKHN